MNFELKNLDKTTLIKQTHETVKQEKMYTMNLLQHLLEIENRGLHLELGFSNLHNFLVVEFKYSDSEAATRVQAMRLLKAHPIVKEKIAQGTISLSQAADINRFIKAESVSVSSATLAPTEGRAISITKIIEEVAGKSGRESKDFLDRIRSAPKPTTYSIEVDEEAWTILQEIKKKELSTSRDSEFTKKILKERLEKLNELLSKKKKEIAEKPKDKINEKQLSRSIGKIKRGELLQEANYQCQYISPSMINQLIIL